MKLLEFVSWCQLSGYVESLEEVEADWDVDADHYKVMINNGTTRVSLVYAVMLEQGVIVSSSIYTKTDLGIEAKSSPTMSEILEKFFPNGSL